MSGQRLIAEIQFLGSRRADEVLSPSAALAAVIRLLVGLGPTHILYTVLMSGEETQIELEVGFDRADSFATFQAAIVRAEGEAGFQSHFLTQSALARDGWMAATATLPEPHLPTGEAFAVVTPIENAFVTMAQQARLANAAFGYCLALRSDPGDPGIAKTMAPALVVAERDFANIAGLAESIRETMAIARFSGWTCCEALCLHTSANDAVAAALEHELRAQILKTAPYTTGDLVDIAWRRLDQIAPPPPTQDIHSYLASRRALGYLQSALSQSLAVAYAAPHSSRPPVAQIAPGHSAALPPLKDSPFVFLSYAHRDSEAVIVLARHLQAAGVNLWFDESIAPGAAWDEYLEAKLRGCGLLLAAVSPAYEASRYCRREIKFADVLAKPILPIALGPYAWGEGLAFLFQELQIMALTPGEGGARIVARVREIAPGCVS